MNQSLIQFNELANRNYSQRQNNKGNEKIKSELPEMISTLLGNASHEQISNIAPYIMTENALSNPHVDYTGMNSVYLFAKDLENKMGEEELSRGLSL